MPESPFGKIMAAVDPADVATLALVEAMRAVADGQKRIADEAKETATMLMDVRERVIRIESNRLDTEVAEVKAEVKEIGKRVDSLEAIKDRQDGAMNLFQWVFRNWPAVLGYLAMIVVVLRATGKI